MSAIAPTATRFASKKPKHLFILETPVLIGRCKLAR